jgi:hypothetical protein
MPITGTNASNNVSRSGYFRLRTERASIGEGLFFRCHTNSGNILFERSYLYLR